MTSARLLDGESSSRSTGVVNADKVGYKARGKTCDLSDPRWTLPPSSQSSASSSEGYLFSLNVRLELTGLAGEEEDEADTRRLRGNDLVSVRSSMWAASDVALLGVVQSWDPVVKQSWDLVRIIVCANSAGGDGAGGRGGWLPLRDIQEGVGKRARGGGGGGSGDTPITICRSGTLTTSCREYQAVMSLSELPASTRRCLLDPAVSKEVKASSPRPKPPALVVRSPSFSVTLGPGAFSGRGGAGGGAAAEAVEEAAPPPANVPIRLWEAVVRNFNRSQARAIRKVADGSPSGFTLLQVRYVRLDSDFCGIPCFRLKHTD